jgi:hypothetical protein
MQSGFDDDKCKQFGVWGLGFGVKAGRNYVSLGFGVWGLVLKSEDLIFLFDFLETRVVNKWN